MINVFLKTLRDSLNTRRQAGLPRIASLVVAVIIFTLIYCLFAIYIVPSNKPADFNFQEDGAITALSVIYLALACGFAIAANLIHKRSEGSYQWLWIVLSLGLAFLAFDELLQFHERIGSRILEQIMPQVIFRNWNDVIVIMYGVVAVPVMLLLLPSLLKYRIAPELFIAAFVFYAIHTVIDSTQEPPTLTTIILEESAKLFSAAFLAIGSFTGFLGNIWQFVSTHSEDQLLASSGNVGTPNV